MLLLLSRLLFWESFSLFFLACLEPQKCYEAMLADLWIQMRPDGRKVVLGRFLTGHDHLIFLCAQWYWLKYLVTSLPSSIFE